jgi:hypothetical protein
MTTQKGEKSATEATVSTPQEIDQPLPDDQFTILGERGEHNLFSNGGTTLTNRQFIIADTNAEEPSADQGKHPDFDRNDDEETVVLGRQLAVAVYRTFDGGLIVRQERDWNAEDDTYDDTYIVISPQNVSAFVDRLVDVAGIPHVGGPEVPPSPGRRC